MTPQGSAVFGDAESAQGRPLASKRNDGSFSAKYGGESGRNRPRGQDRCRWFCLFFLFLVSIPFLFVCFYHSAPCTTFTIILLITLTSLIPLTWSTGETVTITPAGPILSATMFACAAVAILGSMRCYYAHVVPMRELYVGRQYQRVYPQQPAAVFGDASFMTFVGSTRVDVSKAVNFKSLDSGFNTFCVAPVVNDANVGRVEFWATGIDCCGDAGGFDCGDAKDSSAKSAWVVQTPDDDDLYDWAGKYISPPEIRRDIFLQAVKQAEHTHNLVTNLNTTVLVRWTKDTRNEIRARELNLVILTLALVIVCGLLMSLVLTRITEWCTNLWISHQPSWQRDSIDASVRLESFLQSMNAQWSDMRENMDQYRPKLTIMDACLMSVLLPFMVLLLSMIVATYSGCWRHGGQAILVPFLVCVFILVFSLMMTKSRVVTGFCVLLAALSGLDIGIDNYEKNMFHYCSIEDKRTYENVFADADSKEYRDAGRMTFDTTSHLSQNHSVGFLYHDVTYCVAPVISSTAPCYPTASVSTQGNGGNASTASAGMPILLQRSSRHHRTMDVDNEDDSVGLIDDGDAPDDFESALQLRTKVSSHACKRVQPRRVEFWAIGTDCCDSRGNFHCDDGKDASAKSGIVIRAPLTLSSVLAVDDENDEKHLVFQGEHRQMLKNAVDQSVAAHLLPKPENIIFVRWGKNAKHLQNDYKWRALGTILLSSIISLILFLCIGFGSHFYLKEVRNREPLAQRMTEEAQERKQPARRTC